MPTPTENTEELSSSHLIGLETPKRSSQQQQETWKTVSSKRKCCPLKAKLIHKQTKLTNYWLRPPTSTTNKFAELSVVDSEPLTNTETEPPPIFISDEEKLALLQALLASASVRYDI